MGILDQYKKAIEEEKERSMDFPTDTNLTENDKDAYEAALNKMRNGDYTNDEIDEAIQNSKKNMAALNEDHIGGVNEKNMKTIKMERYTDKQLMEKGLIVNDSIKEIHVVRAYCPICGKELKSKTPPMYNPFTMEKVCMHECCGTKFNLDKTYPHIAFIGNDGEEIETFM